MGYKKISTREKGGKEEKEIVLNRLRSFFFLLAMTQHPLIPFYEKSVRRRKKNRVLEKKPN